MFEQILPANLFAAALVFARIGSAVMLLPGIGEAYVNARLRLAFALALTLLALPVLSAKLPAMPGTPLAVLTLLGGEIVIGLFLGTVARVMLSALQVAGSVISVQLGLSAALIFNPLAQQQEAITSTFLSVAGVLVIFLADIHHLMLRALIDSYGLFTPGATFAWGDFSSAMARATAESFRLGIELASPFMVVGTIFYVAVGLISRLSPQLQILFAIQPLQIVAGLVAFALLLSSGMQWFLERFASELGRFIGS